MEGGEGGTEGKGPLTQLKEQQQRRFGFKILFFFFKIRFARKIKKKRKNAKKTRNYFCCCWPKKPSSSPPEMMIIMAVQFFLSCGRHAIWKKNVLMFLLFWNKKLWWLWLQKLVLVVFFLLCFRLGESTKAWTKKGSFSSCHFGKRGFQVKTWN